MFEQISIFEMLQTEESWLRQEVRKGSGYEGGRVRIFIAALNLDESELADFLKDEYGTGGHSITFQNYQHGFTDYNSNGIEIREWKSDNHKSYKWKEVAREIKRLIYEGDYLNENDKQKLTELEKDFGGSVTMQNVHPRMAIKR